MVDGFFSHVHVQTRREVRGLCIALAVLLAMLVVGPTAVARAATLGASRIDLRVLVIDDGSPGVAALTAEMDREGVPYDSEPTSAPITAATASAAGTLEGPTSEAPHAKYQAVVLPNDAPAGVDAAELATLATYERKYGVRQVDSYLFPTAAVGLVNQWSGVLDGQTATVTPAGLSGPFSYLKGPVKIDNFDPAVDESFGYLALPGTLAAGQTFEPLLTAQIPSTTTAGSIVGVFTDNGREQLVINGSFNASQQWFQTIAHGILTWATRGVHLGYNRSYFSMHVDDIFLPDSRWSQTGKCTPGDDFCSATTTDIRMIPSDVARLTAWQDANNLKLDMVFNGGGSEVWKTDNDLAVDPLAAAFTTPATASQFWWINHTYTHPFLGCIQVAPTAAGQSWRCATSVADGPRQDPELVGTQSGSVFWLSQASILSQVQDNIDWANTHNLTGHFDPTELVTGEHSGLKTLPQQPTDNPFLGPALDAEHIAYTASDASRESTARTVEGGTTRTVPRHPMNIFYNAATFQDEVSEYNWIYTSAADGGSGTCTANPATSTCITPLAVGDDAQAKASFDSYIKPLEERIALSHMLTNDPRPHYAHQSNLAEDGILYPVLESLVQDYRAAFSANAPIVQPTQTQAGQILARSDAWAPTRSSATAYLDKDGVHVPDAGAVDVPVTVPAGSTGATLDSYAGELSSWLTVATTLTVPDVGYHAGAVPDAPTGVTGLAGNGKVSLSWTASTVPTGGDAVTSYQITPYDKAGVAQPVVATASTAVTAEVTGLTNGSPYTFTVAATNASGTGAASAPSAAVTPVGEPVAPTAVSGTAGNAAVSLTWTAPSSEGGAPVSSYIVTPYVGATARPSINTGSAATTYTVDGLTNGTAYTFRVAASNSIGTGAASAPSAAVTPAAATSPPVPPTPVPPTPVPPTPVPPTPALATVPAAPTGVTAARGNRKAAITWTAPADHGSAITGYVITPFVGKAARPATNVATASTTATIGGLVNGTAYTFTVAAVNGVGRGPNSLRSNAVTPIVGLTAVMRRPSSSLTLRRTVTYSWALSPAGQVASGYQVYVKRAAFGRALPATWTLLRTVTGTSTPVTFAAGQTVVVAVKPIDPSGQPTLMSAATRAVTYPRAVSGFSTTGKWSKVADTRFFHSPALQTTRRGAVVRTGRVVKATRIALVATGGRRSGIVDVFVGGHRAWSLNLGACKSGITQVCTSKATVQRTGQLVIKVRSTGKPVRLQGIAVLR